MFLGFTDCAATQAQPAAPTIAAFDKPFLFAYSNWDKVAKVEAGHLILQTPTGQGGLGDNFTPVDLSKQSDSSPALRLRIGPNNKETKLRVMLSDSKGGFDVGLFA